MAIRMTSDISHAKCEHFARHFDAKRNVKHLAGPDGWSNETPITLLARWRNVNHFAGERMANSHSRPLDGHPSLDGE